MYGTLHIFLFFCGTQKQTTSMDLEESLTQIPGRIHPVIHGIAQPAVPATLRPGDAARRPLQWDQGDDQKLGSLIPKWW